MSVEYAIGPLRPGDGEAIAAWRYEPPWDVYDLAPDEAPTADEGYLGVYDGDVLLGFFCTGEEARVPGLAAESSTSGSAWLRIAPGPGAARVSRAPSSPTCAPTAPPACV
ncbi:hypothetical protein FK268_12285 [Tsukamurella sputi]|uniref:GNAT family N-acetyltransferase n=1 Tax=Tsukamurella sputi TaxID=2591848 RepID=A0A5C5RQI7_9ACTN|nr:hypothetical protein [Tsukamurella sputi]TWS24365.1 hypothetical protein FK268_12285 [Tsukamurella sputi]